MKKNLTIWIEAEAYNEPHSVMGHLDSRFLTHLARRHVVGQNLVAEYAAMAGDEAREARAEAWTEAILFDVFDEPERDQ